MKETWTRPLGGSGVFALSSLSSLCAAVRILAANAGSESMRTSATARSTIGYL
jgi:hypothetical protein